MLLEKESSLRVESAFLRDREVLQMLTRSSPQEEGYYGVLKCFAEAISARRGGSFESQQEGHPGFLVDIFNVDATESLGRGSERFVRSQGLVSGPDPLLSQIEQPNPESLGPGRRSIEVDEVSSGHIFERDAMDYVPQTDDSLTSSIPISGLTQHHVIDPMGDSSSWWNQFTAQVSETLPADFEFDQLFF